MRKVNGPRSYPKEVEVKQGNRWRIKFTNKTIENSKHAKGLNDPFTKEMTFKLGEPATDLFEYFIHENLHALEQEYQFALEHWQVYELQKALSDWLRLNIHVINKILKRKEKL